MGWKANTSLIQTNQKVEDQKILSELGYNFEQKRNSNLDLQLYTSKYFSIGEFLDIKIICHETLPLEGIGSRKVSDFEQKIIKLLNPDRMLSFGLQSSMNVFGYSLIEGNRKIRVNAGSINGKLYEFGERTVEEVCVYNENVLKSNIVANNPGIIESYFGEEYIFELSRRFFDKRLDQLELNKIKMRCYTLYKKKESIWQIFTSKLRLN